jgi:hypothetical protein
MWDSEEILEISHNNKQGGVTPRLAASAYTKFLPVRNSVMHAVCGRRVVFAVGIFRKTEFLE